MTIKTRLLPKGTQELTEREFGEMQHNEYGNINRFGIHIKHGNAN